MNSLKFANPFFFSSFVWLKRIVAISIEKVVKMVLFIVMLFRCCKQVSLFSNTKFNSNKQFSNQNISFLFGSNVFLMIPSFGLHTCGISIITLQKYERLLTYTTFCLIILILCKSLPATKVSDNKKTVPVFLSKRFSMG